MALGTTDDVVKWSSIIVSMNGRKLIGMVNKKFNEIKYEHIGSINYNTQVKLLGTGL